MRYAYNLESQKKKNTKKSLVYLFYNVIINMHEKCKKSIQCIKNIHYAKYAK